MASGGSEVVGLVRDELGLALVTPAGVSVRAAAEALAHPRRGRDLLGRAVKAAIGRSADLLAQPEVIDATAGLGADSFHLAAAGVGVTMVERVPEIAALLADALERAEEGLYGEPARVAASRLRLEVADARELLAVRVAAGRPPAVVVLDPMYPETGKSALPPKGMALFRRFVGQDADADELLAAALRSATRRVVVKRPLKAPPLGSELPSGSLRGSTTRYDLYAPVTPPPGRG